jgi:cytidine deaminase
MMIGQKNVLGDNRASGSSTVLMVSKTSTTYIPCGPCRGAGRENEQNEVILEMPFSMLMNGTISTSQD